MKTNSFFKFQLSLFIFLFLFQIKVGAVEKEIPLGYDLAWQKIIQTLVLEGINLSTNN